MRRRRVRSDVAIPRSASPLERRPRRLRSPAGSCTRKRRGFPADGAPGRTFQSRPASPHRRAPLGEPHPADACPFSTDPRPPRPPRREARPAFLGFADGARLITGSVQPPISRKASLLENDPAFHLDDPRNCRDSPEIVNTGQPALGRAATTLGSAPCRLPP